MKFTVPIVRSITIPSGATTGQRIVIDGDTGKIQMYDSTGTLREEFFAGNPTGQNIYYPNGTLKMSIDTNGIKMYDTAGHLRQWLGNGIGSYIYLYTNDPNEVTPSQITAASDTGTGYFEIVGPVLTGMSQPSTLALTTYAALTSPGPVNISGLGNITLTAPQTHISGTFVVDSGFVGYVGQWNCYDTLALHSNAAMILDAGSWIKNFGLNNLAFQNGWFNFGGGYQTGQYAMMANQVCQLWGVVAPGNTTGGTVIANIPAGARPSQDHVFICGADGGRTIQIVVRANGNVSIQNASSAGYTWVSLGNINWPIAGF